MNKTLTVLVGLALCAAACGSDGDEAEAAPAVVIDGQAASDGTDGSNAPADGESAAAGSEATDEELALAFAQCMRDNGLPEFQDPVVSADGSIDLVPGGPGNGAVDTDDPAVTEAFEACGDMLDGASFLPGADLDEAEIEDDLLAMAECLRDLGNDVDDPDLGGGFGPGQITSLFGDGFDPTDPANADDISTCQQTVFGPGGAPGFGGGGN